MICRALLRTSFALGLLALITGCAELPPTTTNVAPTPPPQGYWNGDGVSGSPKIIVSIADQRAYFFKGKQLVGESTVSTGKPGFGTPPGYYTVFWKHADHVSSVFGDYVDDFGNVVKSNIDSRKDSKPPGSHYDGARMPFAMFFRGGYAMHQGYVPPYAASHGCIRLPQGMAEVFFNASPPGTPVIVKQEAVMHTVPAPAVDVVPPPVPYPVVSAAPPAVRPAALRSTVPAPTAVPLRSPGPASVRPAALRSVVPSPTPIPLRSPAAPLSRKPVPVQSPAPLQTSSPFPLRAPPPAVIRRSTVPASTPSPAPLRSPAATTVRSPAPTSVQPTPTPVNSRTKSHVRKRTHRRSSAPSPTPTPPR